MAGHPTYPVNVIKLNWEIVWTGVLPHLSGLPHLPGVSHLHVNKTLSKVQMLGSDFKQERKREKKKTKQNNNNNNNNNEQTKQMP